MRNYLLDCTLRDGAHINDGRFGERVSNEVVNGLIDAGVDFVELGFLEPNRANDENTYFASINECINFFKDTSKFNSKLGLMVRTDRCELSSIEQSDFVDFIRIAFYPEHLNAVMLYSQHCADMNYEVYLNLIATPNYTISEIRSIIKMVFNLPISGISIVDTYGTLDKITLEKILFEFKLLVPKKFKIGLHLHENIHNSMMLINYFCETLKDRELIIDSSLNGMGRIPGNIPTELVANYLNNNQNLDYNLKKIFILSESITKFKSIKEWGYSPIYAYSAILGLDRSYSEYFEDKLVDFKGCVWCLEELVAQKAPNRFDEKYAIDILSKYNAN